MADRWSRGLEWGNEVALAVLAWRSVDGFAVSIPSFTGGTAVGQWRPTPPAFGPMSSQTIAFTMPFAVFSPYQFRPATPRGLTTATYTADFNAVKALGRKTGSTRTADQTELAPSGSSTRPFTGTTRRTRSRAPTEPRCARTSACLRS